MSFLEGIDHVALLVRDVARSVEWYHRVLGLERRHADAWGDAPAVVGIGTTSLALFQIQTDRPKPRPGTDTLAMRHVAFRASGDGFQAAQSHLKALGIGFTFQDHDVSHSIYFSDPDGHEIEITTYDVGAS